MPTPRLVTIPYSHYCEKARWALERGGVKFLEEMHAPIFAWRGALGAGGGRTVPVLVTDDGVFPESTDVLRWVDAHGRPPEPYFPPDMPEVEPLVSMFDRKLGPATRRVGYFHVLRGDPSYAEEVLTTDVPAWEARGVRAFGWAIRRAIRFGLKIDEAGAARSKAVIDEVFAAVNERLADGRSTLAGDAFTAADLTFAALAGPLIMPPAYAKRFGGTDRLPSPLAALRKEALATKAGAFAMRIYEAYR
ncbi:Glutathione S-transferase family protein [Labilithrix luteola]|uniref:Glutathione S-transferase family protein n=1 Tax=Labilithrix luteola TaxID=1391654 RepID=A0A0K1Q8C9_9BACT|nr:glutathione S-transferase N-terminal domain-containing protein [Labilithrix luteola]AKV02066.1 Glutathione S-transferase family protein [Labilithrix luteola]